MECSSCGSTFDKPDIVDDSAYFVCSSCGNLREVKGYRELSLTDSIRLFESRFGFVLPSEFISLLGKKGSWAVELPKATTPMTKCYFGDGVYEFQQFPQADPNCLNGTDSIFCSSTLVEEWGLPKGLLLIDGDGHTWLALDYRIDQQAPRVIVIETESFEYLVVASSFNMFLSQIIHSG